MRGDGSRDSLGIALLYPDLLGTYGDRGNALALAHRARARGIPARIIEVEPGQAVPRSADVYCLGGGEDVPQALAADLLRVDAVLAGAIERGAGCLAVCAGYQLLSRGFGGPGGTTVPGLGLLDVVCGRLPGPRAVGEIVSQPLALAGGAMLTGYENHQGDAVLGPTATPLAQLRVGVGNGDGRTEGTVATVGAGLVVATYLHGPVLVRNPALADDLLARARGVLAPLDEPYVDRLRTERLRAAATAKRRGKRR